MIKDIDVFFEQAKPLVEAFVKFMTDNDADRIAQADHFCYKCATTEEFEHLRSLFEFESRFVFQSIISERRIAYIELSRPLETPFGPLKYLELSDQRKDGSQKGGFDHIELYPTKVSYDELVETFEKRGVKATKVVRPHHTTYDISLEGGFLIRLEKEALIDKIKAVEMG